MDLVEITLTEREYKKLEKNVEEMLESTEEGEYNFEDILGELEEVGVKIC